jgi:hypothetical protein
MTAMNRRDFVKGTVVSLASARIESSSLAAGAESPNIVTLGNDQLIWEFSMAGKKIESAFLTNRHSIGDPWKDAIYGYSYFDGNHGFVFLNNMSFESRRAQFHLGKEIGLTTGIGKFRLRFHHPAEEILV